MNLLCSLLLLLLDNYIGTPLILTLSENLKIASCLSSVLFIWSANHCSQFLSVLLFASEVWVWHIVNRWRTKILCHSFGMDVGSQILREYRSTVIVLIAFFFFNGNWQEITLSTFFSNFIVGINSAKMYKTSETSVLVFQELFGRDSNQYVVSFDFYLNSAIISCCLARKASERRE